MTATPAALRDHADWPGAAQALINGLSCTQGANDRIELLESVCIGLGDSLYPAFLQILQFVEQHGNYESKQLVARTLVDCLICGRLPMGAVAAWGSSTLTGDTAFGQTRRLGPIEYVCVWFAQGGTQHGLSEPQCRAILGSLMNLVDTDPDAKRLYIQKLRSDAADPMSGSLSSSTRKGLIELASSWDVDGSCATAVESFLNGLAPQSLLDNIALPARDFLLDR